MNDTQMPQTQTAAPAAASIKEGGVLRKLLLSHLSVAAVGVLVVAILSGFVLWMRTRAFDLAAAGAPTVRAATSALAGIQHSMEALQGWVVLGAPTYKQRREKAWVHEIMPAVEELRALESKRARPDDAGRISELVTVLGRLSDAQWWIEEVAQTPGNEPARVILTETAGPLADSIAASLAALADGEHGSKHGDPDLAPSLAEARTAFAAARVSLADFLATAALSAAQDFGRSVGDVVEVSETLTGEREALDAEQNELLDTLRRDLDAYQLAAREILTLRKSDGWNLALERLGSEVMPAVEQANGILNQIAVRNIGLMRSDTERVITMSRAALAITALLTACMLIATWMISVANARRIAEPLTALAIAARDLRVRGKVKDLPVVGDDEIGQLAAAVNRLRRSAAECRADLDASRDRFSAVFEATPSAMLLADGNGIIIVANGEAERLYGYGKQELLGRSIEMLTPPRLLEDYRKRLAVGAAAGGAGADGSFYALRKDGSEVPIDARLAPIKIAGESMLLSASVDISERTRVEEELTLRAAELERSNVELQQFAYVASHDLQEPLRAVGSYCQLLQRKYEDQFDEKGKRWLSFVVSGTERMRTLVQDLLAFSRVDSWKNPFEPTDCSKVFSDAVNNLKSAIEEADARVTCGALPTIMADGAQLSQLLQNLIGNAVKFRGEAQPAVHVSAEERDGQWLFSVKDNGIGIKAQYADRIFEIFKRLHRAEEYAGTGIGLAVCKKVVERHGGKIWVESEPGEGSTFYFTIPVAAEEVA